MRISTFAQGEGSNTVPVSKLSLNSKLKVECWCEKCDGFFLQEYRRNHQYCPICIRKVAGLIKRGKSQPQTVGELNHNWKSGKSDRYRYRYNVKQITSKHDLSSLPNYDKPRTLAGVEGGYQLDHMVSIEFGFDNDVDPNIIGSIHNLAIVSWQENNNKRGSSSITLDELVRRINI